MSEAYDPYAIPRSGDGGEHRRNLTLVNVLIMTLMVCIDMSIVGVALPVMAKELGVGMGDVQWVNTGYLLVSCAGILIGGRLGDIYGKVRVFMCGVALFTVGSLMCGIAPTLEICILGRAVQGLGAAAAFSNNQGIITETFPTNERGHALGWIATAASLGALIGPTLGGFILTIASWGGIFLVNVPFGIVLFTMGLKILPNRKPAHPGKLDKPGSVLLFCSLMLVVSAVTELQQSSAAIVWAQLVLGLVLLAGFVLVERRSADPVFPLSILRNKTLLINMFTMFALFFVIGGQSMVLPFYFQDARGMTAGESGLFMTVIPIITGTVGPVAGALSDRIGCYWPTCVGACACVHRRGGREPLGRRQPNRAGHRHARGLRDGQRHVQRAQQLAHYGLRAARGPGCGGRLCRVCPHVWPDGGPHGGDVGALRQHERPDGHAGHRLRGRQAGRVPECDDLRVPDHGRRGWPGLRLHRGALRADAPRRARC